jgi:hypothetical protein
MASPRDFDDGQRAVLHTIAKEAARETLNELFFTMGYDMAEAEDRKELIADLAFLRRQRQTYAEVGGHVLKTIAFVIAVAVCTAIYSYLKTSILK